MKTFLCRDFRNTTMSSKRMQADEAAIAKALAILDRVPDVSPDPGDEIVGQEDEPQPRFSLDAYEMQRDPGESDEDFISRLNLFR
jgi:hypothetical protein